MKIAVLIAVFNRKTTTLGGLTAFFAAVEQQRRAEFKVFLVDDASPDGTALAVRETFPDVTVIDGSGALWWVRAMDVAYRAALDSGEAWDAFLLYNDDVVLDPGALGRLVETFSELNAQAPAALYGSMRTQDGKPSYPGRGINPAHRWWRPFNPRLLAPVLPNGQVRACDTFHANCLLVPSELMNRLGGMNPKFHHRHGDTDLGFRLKRLGCRNLIMPDYVGTCELNAPFPIAPTIKGRLYQGFNPPNPIWDEIRMVFGYYPWPIACANSLIRFAYLARDVFWPRRPVMSHDCWQRQRDRRNSMKRAR